MAVFAVFAHREYVHFHGDRAWLLSRWLDREIRRIHNGTHLQIFVIERSVWILCGHLGIHHKHWRARGVHLLHAAETLIHGVMEYLSLVSGIRESMIRLLQLIEIVNFYRNRLPLLLVHLLSWLSRIQTYNDLIAFDAHGI